MPPCPTGDEGFSLVEALVASALLIGGVASIAPLFTLAAASTRAAGEATRAAIAAAQKAEELSLAPWEEVRTGQDVTGPFVRRWSVSPLPEDAAGTAAIAIVVQRPGRTEPAATLALLRTRTAS